MITIAMIYVTVLIFSSSFKNDAFQFILECFSVVFSNSFE